MSIVCAYASYFHWKPTTRDQPNYMADAATFAEYAVSLLEGDDYIHTNSVTK